MRYASPRSRSRSVCIGLMDDQTISRQVKHRFLGSGLTTRIRDGKPSSPHRKVLGSGRRRNNPGNLLPTWSRHPRLTHAIHADAMMRTRCLSNCTQMGPRAVLADRTVRENILKMSTRTTSHFNCQFKFRYSRYNFDFLGRGASVSFARQGSPGPQTSSSYR